MQLISLKQKHILKVKIQIFKVNIRLHNLLEEFIIQGGFNIAMLEDDVAYDVDIVNFNFTEDGEY